MIFRAAGDLTERLLRPGLGGLLNSERGRALKLIGVGRGNMINVAWQKRGAASFEKPFGNR